VLHTLLTLSLDEVTLYFFCTNCSAFTLPLVRQHRWLRSVAWPCWGCLSVATLLLVLSCDPCFDLSQLLLHLLRPSSSSCFCRCQLVGAALSAAAGAAC
jgi:hypothetical protein